MAMRVLLIAVAAAGLAACSDEPSPSSSASTSTASTAPRAEAPASAAAPAPMPAPKSDAAGPTATDSAKTEPTGALNKTEEQTQMPMAGHGNNHSSPALENKSDGKQ